MASTNHNKNKQSKASSRVSFKDKSSKAGSRLATRRVKQTKLMTEGAELLTSYHLTPLDGTNYPLYISEVLTQEEKYKDQRLRAIKAEKMKFY